MGGEGRHCPEVATAAWPILLQPEPPVDYEEDLVDLENRK